MRGKNMFSVAILLIFERSLVSLILPIVSKKTYLNIINSRSNMRAMEEINKIVNIIFFLDNNKNLTKLNTIELILKKFDRTDNAQSILETFREIDNDRGRVIRNSIGNISQFNIMKNRKRKGPLTQINELVYMPKILKEFKNTFNTFPSIGLDNDTDNEENIATNYIGYKISDIESSFIYKPSNYTNIWTDKSLNNYLLKLDTNSELNSMQIVNNSTADAYHLFLTLISSHKLFRIKHIDLIMIELLMSIDFNDNNLNQLIKCSVFFAISIFTILTGILQQYELLTILQLCFDDHNSNTTDTKKLTKINKGICDSIINIINKNKDLQLSNLNINKMSNWYSLYIKNKINRVLKGPNNNADYCLHMNMLTC